MSHSPSELSGLAFLEGILAGRINPPPVAGLLGYRLTAVEAGRTHYTLQPQEAFTNVFGTVHGGVLTTLLDTAMTAAVWSTQPPGRIAATMALNINFNRPVTQSSGRLHCEGRTLHVGRRTATAEGRLTDAAGQLCAHGTVTCALKRV
ncbi:MAG: PaaI family thioesterase [Desulfosarcinaceae bacterium]|nr:PaaI family thioesterase [Desulfosarcinaceae bacterium]